ncbi:NupC/NupG family nucleoside CNT transporter [Roseibacillus persicicus]|uniref:Nucleoside permease n=1 Tax=Roseibacillus persicicus TaxID=454148 RepID=A0A918TP05_9BACT|nr:NupC/NupG family nucleoside CNT transporter [Roseibacillus persicicus]GHC57151.1 nucleoside permease [Roseibacillus persicicus]
MTGLLGIAVLLGLGYLFSKDRKAIKWRAVGGAFAIQFLIAVIVLFVPWGRAALRWMSEFVSAIIGAGQEGIDFLFGNLGNGSIGFFFFINVLPVIIFFSSLIAVLYYLGVMNWVITLLGGLVSKLLGTSHAESLSATANVFVGQTEAPLVVRPYISGMTRSELFAVMVGGLASIAGSVMAGYASMGVELNYLIAASFMSAPGGLLFAKLLLPETEQPVRKVEVYKDDERPANVFDAAAQGASSGLNLALNVGAMLLAFIGLIAVINLGFAEVGSWFQATWSLEGLFGWVFAPVVWLMGVPWHEAANGGSLIGTKLVANEFIAFKSLEGFQEAEAISGRSHGILTFALCGFANLSSIAILLGGLGVMAPNRRPEIARLGLFAVYAATCSNLMSASIASLFL